MSARALDRSYLLITTVVAVLLIVAAGFTVLVLALAIHFLRASAGRRA
jgi:hypothetical protein